MPTIRKIYKKGNSYTITLPHGTLEHWKQEYGFTPDSVVVTDRDGALRITPFIASNKRKSL